MEENLFEGMEFSSSEEVKTLIRRYNDKHFTDFVVNSCNKRQMVFKCKHGVERKSRSQGKRPNQHYSNMDCEAMIRLYRAKDGKWKVTKFHSSHKNHVISEGAHRFNNTNLTADEQDLVLTLKEANTKTSQIKRMLCERTNKVMTTQRLRNLISKLIPEKSDDDDSLEKYFELIDTEGGTVR